MRNETAFAQLADAADQSQSKLRAAAQEMQHSSERMRQDMASLNQQTESLQSQADEGTACISLIFIVILLFLRLCKQSRRWGSDPINFGLRQISWGRIFERS